MAAKGKVLHSQHNVSEDVDKRWNDFVFKRGGNSTEHKEKAMVLYMDTVESVEFGREVVANGRTHK